MSVTGRITLGRASLAMIVACLSGATLASPPDAPRYTPTDALDLLMAGNVRFSSDLSEHRNADTGRVHDTAQGQSPFAVVLSCADSRVPVELVFDRGVGDVFTVRVAGNSSGSFQAGSIEYAVEHLGSPLLVVLGHSSCGAVKAVASGAEVHGNIATLLAPIAPAVAEAKAGAPDASADALVELAVRANVMRSISDLLAASPTIATAADNGTLRVVGAVYSIETGRVEWLGQHPKQAEIIARAKQPQEAPVAAAEPEAAPAAPASGKGSNATKPLAATSGTAKAAHGKGAPKADSHAAADDHH